MSGKTGMEEPDFAYENQTMSKENNDCGCGGKIMVKSGRHAKCNVNLQRQEVWPHTAISKNYVRRITFDSIEFDAFTATETKIIHSILKKGDCNGLG